jgi:hypothetical protein
MTQPPLRDALGPLADPGAFARAAPAILRGIAGRLDELEAEVTASPDLVSAAASGSYNHPNGFEKLLLMTGPEKTKLLLHTWTEESLADAAAAEHSHNHRWPFATLVLMGAYRFESYDVESTGAAFRYRYVSAGDGDNYALVSHGRAALLPELSFELRPACTCVSDSGTVHRVVPIETPLVTLFLQGRPDREETTVVAEEPTDRTGELPIHRLTEAEWKARLSLRLRMLDAGRTDPGLKPSTASPNAAD